jgi:hypothetical protein
MFDFHDMPDIGSVCQVTGIPVLQSTKACPSRLIFRPAILLARKSTPGPAVVASVDFESVQQSVSVDCWQFG